MLVPALLLLIGLVVYKKVVEPKRAGEREPKASKPAKASRKAGKETTAKAEAKVGKKAEKKADKKAVKVRAASGSARMGSVL